MEQWYCNLCGSTNVEGRAWVKLNETTHIEYDQTGRTEDFWCNNCQEHCRPELGPPKTISVIPLVIAVKVQHNADIPLSEVIDTIQQNMNYDMEYVNLDHTIRIVGTEIRGTVNDEN